MASAHSRQTCRVLITTLGRGRFGTLAISPLYGQVTLLLRFLLLSALWTASFRGSPRITRICPRRVAARTFTKLLTSRGPTAQQTLLRFHLDPSVPPSSAR